MKRSVTEIILLLILLLVSSLLVCSASFLINAGPPVYSWDQLTIYDITVTAWLFLGMAGIGISVISIQ